MEDRQGNWWIAALFRTLLAIFETSFKETGNLWDIEEESDVITKVIPNKEC